MGKKLIRQVPMTKDVKIVKNIKKSVGVFVIFMPMAIYLRRNQYILCRALNSTAFGTHCTTQDENQSLTTGKVVIHWAWMELPTSAAVIERVHLLAKDMPALPISTDCAGHVIGDVKDVYLHNI